MIKQDWHHLSDQEVIKKLDTDQEEGLTTEEADLRLQQYGLNILHEEEGGTILQLIIDQFRDAFIIMLIFAAIASYIVGEPIDALLIFIIIAIGAIIGFIQEYRSEKAMEALRNLTAPTANVIRYGKEMTIPSKYLVPGDIIILDTGDRIPADARLIESVSLKADEAPLTGESTPVLKQLCIVDQKTPLSDRKNFVFMGTHIVFGHGKGVITSTGMKTEFGKIAEAVLTIEEEKAPIKLKLDSFAKKLGTLIMGLCVIIFFIEIFTSGFGVESIIESFLTAIALAVSAVPEALPALIIVTLALGAKQLAMRGAVVRKLASAETLGSVTYICADKTGTLTKGEMTVCKLFVNNSFIEVKGTGFNSIGEFFINSERIQTKGNEHLQRLLIIGTLCNNARYNKITSEIKGDPTEGALLVCAAKAKLDIETLNEQYPRISEIPFSSERKRMTTIHQFDKNKIALIKGAPEVILERSTHIFEYEEIKKLSENRKKELFEINEQMASNGLRILGMAYKDLPNKMKIFKEESVEKGLILVGLQGMKDPPRIEAITAIAKCKEAGIKNVMITGDHKLTAVSIAIELGMISEEYQDMVLTGAELDTLSLKEYEKRVEEIIVYARVSSMHKLKIVEALKKKGEIVAMTGDGVNDAPALKRADIGVAMGITGTDVSKEAADIVLSDDNYATLISAVEGGRVIFDNIRKYIRFLISCNFDELLVVGVWTLLGFPLPLLPTQILFINLVTDGPPAIALSMDHPEKGIMKRPPRNPKAGIFEGMFPFIVASFICQSIGSSICFLYGLLIINSYEKAVTMTFIQAALFELFVIWNCRSETHSIWKMGKSAFNNKFFVVSTILGIIMMISIPYIPFVASALKVVPLNIREMLICILLASSGLWLVLPELFISRGRAY